MKPHLVQVTITTRGGRYVATCEERKISGDGATEREALESLRKALAATIKVRAVSREEALQAEVFEHLEFLLFYAK